MGAIRLFLALVVAIDHLRLFILRPLGADTLADYNLGMNAGFAVMFFYMISGFLMSLVLSQKYEASVAGNFRFYKSRFIRIFSLYWPVVILIFIFVPGAWAEFFGNSLADEVTNVFLVGSDWRLAFASYPLAHWNATPMAIHQAWTLGAELTFYIIAPFLLRSRRASWIALVISVGLRALLVHFVGFEENWTYYFLPSTLLFFMLGHFAQLFSGQWPWIKSRTVGAILIIGCLFSLLSGSVVTWDTFRFWLAVLFFAAALPSIFEESRNSRLLNALGELSYPIYLIHILVMDLLSRHGFFAQLPVSGPVITWSFLGVTTLSAIAAHWLLEKPSATLLYALVRSRIAFALRSSLRESIATTKT